MPQGYLPKVASTSLLVQIFMDRFVTEIPIGVWREIEYNTNSTRVVAGYVSREALDISEVEYRWVNQRKRTGA